MDISINKIISGARYISGSIAAFAAGGVFTLLEAAKTNELLFWSTLFFSISIPLALLIFWVMFSPFAEEIAKKHLVSVTVFAAAASFSLIAGFVLTAWSISKVHGISLLITALLAYCFYCYLSIKSLVETVKLSRKDGAN